MASGRKRAEITCSWELGRGTIIVEVRRGFSPIVAVTSGVRLLLIPRSPDRDGTAPGGGVKDTGYGSLGTSLSLYPEMFLITLTALIFD